MCAPDPPDPPAAPNYQAAAVAQGVANTDAARLNAKLNNPDVINPSGIQTTKRGYVVATDANGNVIRDASGNPRLVSGGPDSSVVLQTLSPDQQALYDRQIQTKKNLGDLGISGSDALRDVIGQNLDLSGTPAAPGSSTETRNKVVDAMMARVNEDTANQREAKSSELIASGIRPGTKAYADAMNLIDRQYNDARDRAILSGGQEAQRDFTLDQSRRKDAIAEILTQRQTPLNEVSALMSGTQVSNPFASNLGFQPGANAAPAPVMQAATSQYGADVNRYNAEAGQYGNTMSGLFSLGAGALNLFSDRRLKRNIRRIGTHRLGIGVYEFEYIWGERSVGVMSDEVRSVMPSAVGNVSGFDTVDYGMIGGI